MNAQKIPDHLAELHKAAPDVFGAKNHRFLLNEPLGEERVQGFEMRQEFDCGDYREFIATIGNGLAPLPISRQQRWKQRCLDSSGPTVPYLLHLDTP